MVSESAQHFNHEDHPGENHHHIFLIYFISLLLPLCSQWLVKCTVIKVYGFLVPSRDVTNQTLPGRELLNYSRPGRVWLMTSRLGTGKTFTFFTVWLLGRCWTVIHEPLSPWTHSWTRKNQHLHNYGLWGSGVCSMNKTGSWQKWSFCYLGN